jgi:hypothetical protein
MDSKIITQNKLTNLLENTSEDCFYYFLNTITDEHLWNYINDYIPHDIRTENTEETQKIILYKNKLFYNQLKKRYPNIKVIEPKYYDNYFNQSDEIVYIKYNPELKCIPKHYFEEECDIIFRMRRNRNNRNNELNDENIPNNESELIHEYEYENDNHPLKKVFIEYGYKTIEERAFAFCCNLSFIHIPSSVVIMQSQIFIYNLSLQKLTLPSIIQIPKELCNHCKELNQVNAKEPIVFIDSKAFRDCVNLHTITLNPDFISYIGDEAFYSCKSLKLKLKLSCIKTILNRAFGLCKSIEPIVEINKDIKYLDESVFEKSSVKEILQL